MSHAMTTHRLATAEDLEAVHAIYMHEDVVPFLGFDPMPLRAFEAVFRSLLATRAFHVVEQDGKVAGFYRLSRHEGRARHVAYLGTFAVAPQAQGSGLARHIIEAAIARLQGEGVLRFELMLEADNPRAHRFYSRLGFTEEGWLRGAYKRASDGHYTDEILMAKLLPAVPPRSLP